MKAGPHPYQEISLGTAGLVLGIILVALYGLMFLKADAAKEIARKLPRNSDLGTYFMGFGMVWFWLLVAPPDKGIFSAITMDLGEFNKVKKYLMIGVPVFCVGMIVYVREFLFVRGLGLCLLMAAAPLLYASDFENAPLQFVMPAFCYIMIIKGLYFVGMPYLFRDGVTWATASDGRWRGLALGGVALGLLFVTLGLTAWRGY
ncbi:hypothetical protein OAF41_01870 [bacterium]|jgi:hypothetical protein|nr:hypothetical protein [Akkermansiaceae bacterium]MDA7886942.1 hypothetical protein [bacterium]MDA7891712.1 hypothetical protein [Akkermansiaceae bacterium]MDA7934017.1 hypothetical protein [Akkermansiaceae bacterium]MDB4369889.1 hypothetical protein [Akkermansiaceae bacterium]